MAHAEELRERWVELYKTPCPPFMRRPLLILEPSPTGFQENAFGVSIAQPADASIKPRRPSKAGRPLVPSQPKVKPGDAPAARMAGHDPRSARAREGVQYRDREWPSLSAVAEEITGAHWSGPRFFGLKEKRRGRK
ncbi:MAG: DUF2924 domain-containing protein [Deltaproteobacteria bacterium]|nr:DUF2924 domain-containing protein [Deltaproteobacteria bacterium]